MAYTALRRCASWGAVYAINPSFSVFNWHRLKRGTRNGTTGTSGTTKFLPKIQHELLSEFTISVNS